MARARAAGREDDAPAFEDFLRRHEPALLRSARFLVGDRETGETAETLVREVLVEMYSRWESLTDPERESGEALVRAYARYRDLHRLGVASSSGQVRQSPAGQRSTTGDKVHGQADGDGDGDRNGDGDGDAASPPALSARVRAVAEQADARRRQRVRRRRRRLLVAVAGAVVVVAVATTVALTAAAPRPVVASETTVVPRPFTVDGVTATWLPEGIGVLSAEPTIEPVGPTDGVLVSGLAGRPQEQNLNGVRYRLAVARGAAVEVESMYADFGAVIDGQLPVPARSWSEVAGQRAVVLARPGASSLWWTVGDALIGVAVENAGAADPLADLRQIAAGVEVGPPPPRPADLDQAVAEVRAAVTTAFDPQVAVAQAVTRVVDGETLVESLETFRREQPATADSVRFDVLAVYFTEVDEAIAMLDVSVLLAPDGRPPGDPAAQTLTTLRLSLRRNDQDGWRIPREIYCSAPAVVLNCSLSSRR